MPTHKSAEKRVITAEKGRQANRAIRSAIRTSLKKIRTAAKEEEVLAEAPNLFSMLDKAARKRKAGITKNTASNYKRKIQALIASKN